MVRFSIVPITGWRAKVALALFSIAGFASSRAASAQTPFDGCGTLVQGVTCPKLFQADSGGTWVLSNTATFQVGDYVRVVGLADPGCITFCQQGGCISNTTIELCAVCSCTGFCFGDGTGPAGCPCGNNGGPGRGCANSVDPSGALLAGSGVSSLSSDTVVLAGNGMPNSSALYFQGTTQTFNLFGDGFRCAGGTIVRLGTKTNVAGASQYPTAGDPSVSVRGQVVSPGSRTYQTWYRNAAAFCTPSTFNLANGLQLTWQP
jgi:hypothetical protein